MKTLHPAALLVCACLMTALAISAADARPTMPTSDNLKQIGVASHAARTECTNNLKQLGFGAAAAKSECSNNLTQMTTTPRASRADVRRLKRMRTKPSAKCSRIEYVQQCISGQTMYLKKANCRAGETEASCCQRARKEVSRFCGRIWDLAKKSGKSWSPGIFTCKCIEQPRARKPELKRKDSRSRRHPPDPIRPR